MSPIRTLPRCVTAVLLAVVLAACSSRFDSTLSGQVTLQTARVALAGGSSQVALNICNQLLVNLPTDSGLLVCKGDALLALGQPTDAVAAYEAALRSSPRSSDAQLGLGRATLTVDPVRAERLFLDALTSDPRNAAALNNLGIAQDLQGRHSDAQQSYAAAIAVAPSMRAAQVNLALSLAMSGRADEAVRMLRPIAARPDASARERHDLAAVLAMDGKSDEAARLLRPELDSAQIDEAVSGYRGLPQK